MTTPISAFIHDTRFADLPQPVVVMAQRCVLDLAGVAAAGSQTALSRIARNHAARQLAAGEGVRPARMMLDGRRVGPAGAAFAGAATIDSFDAHDGHALTKGHAGVAVLPAALALADAAAEATGRALLTNLVIGYEVAIRAGMALHVTACDYHTSGAWNALACAALGARQMRLNVAATRHALGIAEFHGPRSQMMRCIDHPTMVKDGSCWGALAGVSAALLAADGFTGAPALTVEADEVAGLWADLGARWHVLEQYFKPYPVCRWAQPAVEAALALRQRLGCAAGDIAGITVTTFHEAARLATRAPATTEEAQYSLPFPVAAAIVRGCLGAAEVGPDAFRDRQILRLSMATALRHADIYNSRFPAERWAQVAFAMADGTIAESEPAMARGDPQDPLSDMQLGAKYRALTLPVLGDRHSALVEAEVAALSSAAADAATLLELLLEAPASVGTAPGRGRPPLSLS